MVPRRRGPKRSLHETSYERVLQDEKPLRLTAKLWLGSDWNAVLWAPRVFAGCPFSGSETTRLQGL